MLMAFSSVPRALAELLGWIISARVARPHFKISWRWRDRTTCLASNSGVIETLSKQLESPWFEKPVNIKAPHVAIMTSQRGPGTWLCVSDLCQLIAALCLTRASSAFRRN
jgi:hypothetical protein